MAAREIVIVGGGAAGFFAAIACARAAPENRVSIFERGSEFLTKVRISGGGRCNVTHACFEPRALTERYPRGERALIAPFHQFDASDTVTWFEQRGVKLKTEADGRMFPASNSSATIVDCLLREAEEMGVRTFTRSGVQTVERRGEGGFHLQLTDGSDIECERVLLATGGCRAPASSRLPEMLGHVLAPPVPSLFTFHLENPWMRELPGIAVEDVEATVPGTKLRERGALLITHTGVSGPVILRLSAWGARLLHERDYRFGLRVNWLPNSTPAELEGEFDRRRTTQPNRAVPHDPLPPLSARLWERLATAAGISPATRWTNLPREGRAQLAALLVGSEFSVTGKSLNKDEFVTCGGVRTEDVNWRTMESRLCRGLYFAGELLDVDGITGGFNFQAAWTTGWIAGQAMAAG